MATILGKMVVTAAELADVDAQVNLAYPNGVGKKEGMMVYAGAAGSRIMYVASGALPASPWNVVSTVTGAVTPS